MNGSERDQSLDTLLDLDGQVFYMGDKGHRVQVEVGAFWLRQSDRMA